MKIAHFRPSYKYRLATEPILYPPHRAHRVAAAVCATEIDSIAAGHDPDSRLGGGRGFSTAYRLAGEAPPVGTLALASGTGTAA